MTSPLTDIKTPSTASSASSDTNALVNSLLQDILQGNKPKTAKDARKLYDTLTVLLACWLSSDLSQIEQKALLADVWAEQNSAGCFSWMFSKK